MKLREAISKATKFCWKGKQNSPTKYVRFLPNEHGRHAVYATNGPQGILIWLDVGVDVPNVMLAGEALSKAVKDIKDPLLFQRDDGSVVVSGLKMKTGDVAQFPALPTIPVKFKPCPDWHLVLGLLHAVSKDQQQPLLQCLHFAPDYVEATDRFRVSRVFVKGDWSGSVPADIFKAFPKGDVECSFSPEMVVFKIGDELRMTIPRSGKFQDCDALLPAKHEGHWVVLDTNVFRASAKRAKGIATAASLSFLGEKVVLSAPEFLSEHAVLGNSGSEESIRIQVNATWLYEAMRCVSTPNVLLGYTDPFQPLRIESGAYVEGLWPFTAE